MGPFFVYPYSQYHILILKQDIWSLNKKELDMTNFIKDFITMALDAVAPFEISMFDGSNTKYYMFIPIKVGEAKYIHGDCGVDDPDFKRLVGNNYSLYAVVSDGNVYLDEHKFRLKTLGSKLPKNAKPFSLKEFNEYAKKVVFPDFYYSLKTKEITDPHIITNALQDAREIIFTGNTNLLKPDADDVFRKQDIADILNGYISLEEEARKRYEEEKEYWIMEKSLLKKVEEYIYEPNIIKEWELALAKAITSVKARTVNVEFEFNSKKASTKIDPRIILCVLIMDKYFSIHDFHNQREGLELLRHLNINKSTQVNRDVLKCEHISKITYAKKVLYERSPIILS